MARKLLQKLKTYAPLSLKDWVIFIVAMVIACLVCIMLQQVSTSDVHVPIIFVLVVLLISLLTDGYFYGILAALTSVIAVNYAFTEPYMQLDFTLYGYPLTFMTMLAVGVATSTLMSRVKQQEKFRLETEREKLRANLLRGMSHDLRTPLTGISGSISAVLDNADQLSSEQQRELLECAKDDADWLCRMVENLLSVTRIGDGPVGSLHTQEEALAFIRKAGSMEQAEEMLATRKYLKEHGGLETFKLLLKTAGKYGGVEAMTKLLAAGRKAWAKVFEAENEEKSE